MLGKTFLGNVVLIRSMSSKFIYRCSLQMTNVQMVHLTSLRIFAKIMSSRLLKVTATSIGLEE